MKHVQFEETTQTCGKQKKKTWNMSTLCCVQRSRYPLRLHLRSHLYATPLRSHLYATPLRSHLRWHLRSHLHSSPSSASPEPGAARQFAVGPQTLNANCAQQCVHNLTTTLLTLKRQKVPLLVATVFYMYGVGHDKAHVLK